MSNFYRTLIGWVCVNILGSLTLLWFSGNTDIDSEHFDHSWYNILAIITIATIPGTIFYHYSAIHVYSSGISSIKRKASLAIAATFVSCVTAILIGFLYGFIIAWFYIPYILLFALLVPYKGPDITITGTPTIE